MVHVAKEMERAGFHHPAADRRGHDVARPYGGQDRAQLPGRPDGLCAPMPRGPSAWPAVCSATISATTMSTRSARSTRRSAVQHGGRQAKVPMLTIAEARAQRAFTVTGAHYTPAVAAVPGRPHLRPIIRLAELVDYIDWSPFFHDLGTGGQLSRKYWTMRQSGEQARDTVRRCTGHAGTADRGGMADGPRRRSAFSRRNVRGDDVIAVCRRPRAEVLDVLHHLRQQMVNAAGPAQLCLADFVAPRDSGVADYLGGFAVTAGHRYRGAAGAVRAPTTTTTAASCSRPSPTAWPKPSPSVCTSGCAASSGATRPMNI